MMAALATNRGSRYAPTWDPACPWWWWHGVYWIKCSVH